MDHPKPDPDKITAPSIEDMLPFAKSGHNRCNGTGVQAYANGQPLICPCAVAGWGKSHPIEYAKMQGDLQRRQSAARANAAQQVKPTGKMRYKGKRNRRGKRR
jgi:hypothetical protein